MQEDNVVSNFVDVALKDQVLCYICLSCNSTFTRADNLQRHTVRYHQFHVLGLPKLPTGSTRDLLNGLHMELASGMLPAGKRRKVCTDDSSRQITKKHPVSRTTAFGARDVVMARASSSSETLGYEHNEPLAEDLPILISNEVDRYLNRNLSPVSPPDIMAEGVSDGNLAGNMATPCEEPGVGQSLNQGADVDMVNPAAMQAEEGTFPQAGQEDVSRQGIAGNGGISSASTATVVPPGSLDKLTNLEIISENVTVMLLSLAPPWHTSKVLEVVEAEYPEFDRHQLAGIIRSCIRCAKALTSELKYRVAVSGGSWSFGEAVQASRV